MTLKKRIAISIAIAFSILFGIAACAIYYSFASFRQEEFRARLEDKALTTAKLLIEVKEIDKQLLKLIDQNSINRLHNEKTLVFDEKFDLIYSSIDDAVIDWKKEELSLLKTEKKIFKQDKNKEILGIFYDFEQTDYYVLTAAEDIYGQKNLNFLLFSLISTFLTGIFLVWAFTYYFIKSLLKPLDTFQEQITNISANHLDVQLDETSQNDEINLLTKAFNQMLLRIEQAFESQRTFASNASHELRTPLTRIAFQTENLLQNKSLPEETQTYLKNINRDTHQLSDLVNSLLLLSKFNNAELQSKFKKERIDEIVFTANNQVKAQFSDFDLDFEIKENLVLENTLEVLGVKSLLIIALQNILKNAYLYSSDKKAKVVIEQLSPHSLRVCISNRGQIINELEQKQLFEPFFRGSNAAYVQGSGLGLRITKRILDYHQATICYNADTPNINQFNVVFSS